MATTTARAEPETTVVPVNTMLAQSPTVSAAAFAPWGSASFSTGSLSPVRVVWFTKRSFASITRASAGMRSPAASSTMWIGNTYLDDSGRDSPASLNSTGDM